MNSVPTNLWEWLAPIQPDERFALCITSVVVGLTAVVCIIGLISHTVGKIHRTRVEAALKRELLDRGLSAEEIVNIVEASASPQGLRLRVLGRAAPKETGHAYAK
jgi:hypothetical protein